MLLRPTGSMLRRLDWAENCWLHSSGTLPIPPLLPPSILTNFAFSRCKTPLDHRQSFELRLKVLCLLFPFWLRHSKQPTVLRAGWWDTTKLEMSPNLQIKYTSFLILGNVLAILIFVGPVKPPIYKRKPLFCLGSFKGSPDINFVFRMRTILRASLVRNITVSPDHNSCPVRDTVPLSHHRDLFHSSGHRLP